MSNNITIYDDGIVINGAWPDIEMLGIIKDYLKQSNNDELLKLIIADPPYGNIVNEDWDKEIKIESELVERQILHAKALEQLCVPGAALYWFGGYCKPQWRPWYRWLCEIEHQSNWRMAMPITWRKKRAYGVQWNYLSTREEIAYCVLGDIKKPHLFNVPYTDEIRGYAGYDENYPAKSEYKRQTGVWDVSEIFKGKRHACQKPSKLLKIPIEAHTNPGDYVFDPYAGSGSTGYAARQLGRKFILVERAEEDYTKIVEWLNDPKAKETI